jgi:hypothetical protein
MWKRDEAVKPTVAPSTPAVQSHGGPAPAPQPETRHLTGRDVVNIGKSVVIKGELNGSEDLTIEGQVEGKIELKDHVLTIGPNGKIKAQVFAKALIVSTPPKRWKSATAARSMATSCHPAWRSPRAPISVGAWTCSAKQGSSRRVRSSGRPPPQPFHSRSPPSRLRSRSAVNICDW